MKNINSMLFLMLGAVSLNAEEPVCHHCEEIREYNAKYHKNYEYYDDYLKAEKNEQSQKEPAKDLKKPIEKK